MRVTYAILAVFQMSHVCWYRDCKKDFNTRSDLRNHVGSHGFLRVVCPWCPENGHSHRRMVDLRAHVRERHPSVYQEDRSLDFLREKWGVYVAINPADYIRVVGRPSFGPQEEFLKDAVRSWCAGSKGSFITEWEERWATIKVEPKPRAYSPTRPAMDLVISVLMNPLQVLAILWVMGHHFRRVSVKRSVLQQPRKREALFRRMTSASAGEGVPPVPSQWEQNQVHEPLHQYARALGIEVGDIEKVEVPRNASPFRKRHHSPLSSLPASPKVTILSTPSNSPPTKLISDTFSPVSNCSISRKETSSENNNVTTPVMPPKTNTDTQQLSPTVPTCIPSPLVPTCIPSPPYQLPGEPSLPTSAMTPSYEPSPSLATNLRPAQQSVDLQSTGNAQRARVLLLEGGMPLFPPARRDWSLSGSVVLPLLGPVKQWPPTGWQEMQPDDKLMAWEAVAYMMSASFGMPMRRSIILDSFQCLALPGSKDPHIQTAEDKMRHGNFKAIRSIALGTVGSSDEALLNMFQSAHDNSPATREGGYRSFLQSIADVPLRLTSMKETD